MILPTPNPISLPWSNQPCPSSSPGDPEKWSQAQVWSKTPGAALALWKSWGDVTSVLASPTCRVLPRGARPRGLGPPRCSMFHRDLELGAPRLSPKGQNCSSGHFIWPGRSTDPKACWGDLSLSRLSPGPPAGSQLLLAGGPSWPAGRRLPPVAMALSPPISICITAPPGQGVWLHGGSGWHGSAGWAATMVGNLEIGAT